MGGSARRLLRGAGRLLLHRWRGVPVWAHLLALALIAAVLVRAPAAAGAVAHVFAHGSGLRARWPWLAVVVAGEVVSLAAAAAVQADLLGAGGSRLRWRVLLALSLVTAGLTRVLPAGLVAGGSWLVGEYRRRGIAGTLAVWAVLAGGFASTVSILALLLAGAAVGGLASPLFLAGAGGVLAAGSAGLLAGVRGMGGGWLGRRLHGVRGGASLAAVTAAATGLLGLRAGPRRWLAAIAASGVGWLGDTGVLAASFGLAGLAVPWRGILFACAAGQLAGRLVPLPGGLGGVEGGLIGALTLTGSTAAAATAAVLLYRIAGYWAVGGVGGAALAALTRRRPHQAAAGSGPGAHPAAPAGARATGVAGQPPGSGEPAGGPGRAQPAGGPGRAQPAGTAGQPAQRRPAPGPARTGRSGKPPGRRSWWWLQFLVVAAVLWGVDAADGLRPGAQAAGLVHAPAVEAMSRYLGGGLSQPLNDWLAAHPLPAAAAAAYYIVLNVVVTGVVGGWLLIRRPRSYPLHRNALLAMGLIALTAWWLYPVAPPRMLPGYHDITAAAVPVFASLLESGAAGQFAALPSIHVAWALWVAVAAQPLLRRRAWRAAVWAYPALTVLDVLVTANHYLLDVLTAPAVVLLGYGLAALAVWVHLPRLRVHVLRVRLPRLARPRVPRAGGGGFGDRPRVPPARDGGSGPGAPAGTWQAPGPFPGQAPAGGNRRLP